MRHEQLSYCPCWSQGTYIEQPSMSGIWSQRASRSSTARIGNSKVTILRCLLCHISPCAPAPHLGHAQVCLTHCRSARRWLARQTAGPRSTPPVTGVDDTASLALTLESMTDG